MNVIGVDLSLTATAIADGESTRVIRSKLRGIERLDEISGLVLKAGAAEPDMLVVVEGYTFARAHRLAELGELGGVVRYRLWDAGVRYIDVSPAVVKKYATGKGNAPKPAVLSAAVKRSGIEFATDDESDAWWLRAIGCELLGEPVVEMPALNRGALGALRDRVP